MCYIKIILWVLSATSKRSPVRIIRYSLTKLKYYQHPCNGMRVDEGGALEKYTYITDLLVEYFNIALETTDGYA